MKKTETVVGKEHEKRMKKYRKIWKEKGCIHIGTTLPIDIPCCIMYNMGQCIV